MFNNDGLVENGIMHGWFLINSTFVTALSMHFERNTMWQNTTIVDNMMLVEIEKPHHLKISTALQSMIHAKLNKNLAL